MWCDVWWFKIVFLQFYHTCNLLNRDPPIIVISAAVSMILITGTPCIITQAHWGFLPVSDTRTVHTSPSESDEYKKLNGS